MRVAARESGPGAAPPMDYREKTRLRAAAFRVQKLYPGPVGALLSKELYDWEDFGYRLGGSSLIYQLVEHVETTPLPTNENPGAMRAGRVQ